MKFKKYIVIVAIAAYLFNGLNHSLKEYGPLKAQDNVTPTAAVQVKVQDPGKDQEITPEMDKEIKEKSEKAAVLFVHTIFGPFEEAANDVAKRHPELHNDNKPVVVDGNFRKLITND